MMRVLTSCEQTWSICGVEFTLDLWPEVFQPTSTSECLAQVLHIQPGDSVIDMGCGSGFLAVLAAKLGAASVLAVDIMPQATELTWLNASTNGVSDRLEILTSSLFEQMDMVQVDCLIGDVSGVAEALARTSPWYPPLVPSGGVDGATTTVELLRQAPKYLTPSGRVIFPVTSLANETRILEMAHQTFAQVDLVVSRVFPFPSTMQDQWPVRLVRCGSRWCWELRVFEARR